MKFVINDKDYTRGFIIEYYKKGFISFGKTINENNFKTIISQVLPYDSIQDLRKLLYNHLYNSYCRDCHKRQCLEYLDFCNHLLKIHS